jgi:hypothetical protein
MKSHLGLEKSSADKRRSPRVVIEDLEPRALMSATPLATPTTLSAMMQSPTAIHLSWSDTDSTAQGYFVLRSSNGGAFSPIAQISSASTKAFTDNTVIADTNYQYKIEAYNGGTTSGQSNTARVSTPLPAPTNFAAAAESSASVELTWTPNSEVTAYYIMRSSDGTHFTQLAIVTSPGASGYTDNTVTANHSYTYQVEACAGRISSPFSARRTVTTPSNNNNQSSDDVTLSTRFSDELVITAPGSDDTVDLTQSGNNLDIDADGTTTVEAIPAAGVFVYTRGGTDTIDIASSVTAFTTVDTIDGAPTTVDSSGTDVSAWIDSTDNYTGTGDVHRVASFAGGVSKALGVSLPNPTDAGATTTTDLSLWGTGPVMGDVNQGEVGDCYFLSSLAAFANSDPSMLHQSAVDLGDGTYAVQFYSNGKPEYVRVNDRFSSGPFNGFYYANPGSNDTIWAMVMEKAFCYFRTGANSYASINAGWMGEVYSDLNINSSVLFPDSDSQTAFYNTVSAALNAGEAVTLATSSDAPNLVSDHAYTLVSTHETNGVTYYVVRNPWGVSGDSLENSQGYATLTFAQVQANFTEGCVAT